MRSREQEQRAITGRSAFRLPATAQGFQLVVQALHNIPKKVRDMLSQKWESDFVSYGIVRKPESSVSGSVFLLTNAQRDAVRQWEFVGKWSHNVHVKAKVRVLGITFSVDAESEHLGRQKCKDVDGHRYRTFLVPKEKILRVAREVRV